MKRGTQHLDRDPDFYSEGLEWIRHDLDPPLRRRYEGGKMYEQPYLLSGGEFANVPSSSGGRELVIPISAPTHDVSWYDTSGNWSPAGPASQASEAESIRVARYYYANLYAVYVAILTFDTSAITGAVVSASLRINPSVENADDRSITADWYTPSGTSADYTVTAQTGAISGKPLSNLVPNSDNDITLDNAVANLSGDLAHLRLHISGGKPAGMNRVSFPQYPSALGARLIVALDA